MRRVAGPRNGFAKVLVIPALTCGAVAQISEFLPEVDAYYKVTSELGIWMRAEEIYEACDPVRARFRPQPQFLPAQAQAPAARHPERGDRCGDRRALSSVILSEGIVHRIGASRTRPAFTGFRTASSSSAPPCLCGQFIPTSATPHSAAPASPSSAKSRAGSRPAIPSFLRAAIRAESRSRRTPQ